MHLCRLIRNGWLKSVVPYKDPLLSHAGSFWRHWGWNSVKIRFAHVKWPQNTFNALSNLCQRIKCIKHCCYTQKSFVTVKIISCIRLSSLFRHNFLGHKIDLHNSIFFFASVDFDMQAVMKLSNKVSKKVLNIHERDYHPCALGPSSLLV